MLCEYMLIRNVSDTFELKISGIIMNEKNDLLDINLLNQLFAISNNILIKFNAVFHIIDKHSEYNCLR